MLRRTLQTLTSSSSSSPPYKCIIGLEAHISLLSPVKLFSLSPLPLSPSSKPNTHTHPLDYALPGSLPVLNIEPVKQAIVATTVLGGTVNDVSRFERKHYFYPDLPAGYQITQCIWPIGSGGFVEFDDNTACDKQKNKKKDTTNTVHRTNIIQVQLEQDSGKTTNLPNTPTLLDYNRAGSPLIEIVFAPDITSPAHAASAIDKLVRLLRYTGVTRGRMNKGEVRVDLNVSVIASDVNYHKNDGSIDFELLNERVEVKNLNSLKSITQAAEYEYNRQCALLIGNEKVLSETRTWDKKNQTTVLMRSKDDKLDYRFLPDPDLPVLRLSSLSLSLPSSLLNVQELIGNIRELPEAARKRLEGVYGVSVEVSKGLTDDWFSVGFFEDAVKFAFADSGDGNGDSNGDSNTAKLVSSFICNDLFSLIKNSSSSSSSSSNSNSNSNTGYVSLKSSPVTPLQIGTIVKLINDNRITSRMGKDVISYIYNNVNSNGNGNGNGNSSDIDVHELIAMLGMRIITGPALHQLCHGTINDVLFVKQLTQYSAGDDREKGKMKKFFTGEVMKRGKGMADVKSLASVVDEVLSNNNGDDRE